MNFLDDFIHEPKKLEIEEIEEKPKVGLFDFLTAVTFSKVDLLVDEDAEKAYSPYMMNQGLSFSLDTILLANEMNKYPDCPKDRHFDFMKYSIRKGKRYSKWVKPVKNEWLETIEEYYKCSTRVARQYFPLLSLEELEEMKQKLSKGGKRA